jgi:Zn-dependent metalloprotease
MRRNAPCSIIPPHLLRNIAERGDDDARREAQLALELTAQVRGERAAVANRRITRSGSSGVRIFDARGMRDLPGRRVRGENDPIARDASVNEALDGARKTCDFYRSVYGRNSLDDRGLRVDCCVHYGLRYANALWNGRQLIFGDGGGRYFNHFTSALDVIAHELTHGVTQYSAALEYEAQSGALNEHFSDVFGTLAKQFSLKQTAADADWLIGEGLFASEVQGVAIRSLKAPGTAYDDRVAGKDPQPAHINDYVTTDLDNGGVHINSGIPNRAFFELATLLGGKAWEVAGKIWYRALTAELRPRRQNQRVQ